jgi:hypothetical protein
MPKYVNITKRSARGWAWNQLKKRIRHPKKARVYCLIGDTTEELETAQKKGFSPYNVIGVDVQEEAVRRWRQAGGLAIQAPIEAVINFSKVQPHGVIADFCGGLTEMSFRTFEIAIYKTAISGGIVMNLLRGRDEIKKFRPEGLENFLKSNDQMSQMIKKRSVVLLYQLFDCLYRDHPDIVDCTERMRQLAKSERMLRKHIGVFRELQDRVDTYFEEFRDKLAPEFYEYKSQDSSQMFDSLAINSFMAADDCVLRTDWSKYNVEVIQRRLVALEAVRTTKLNKLPERRRIQHEPYSDEVRR